MSDTVIEVFRPGTKATVAGNLPVLILAAILDDGGVWYRIGYWDNNSWTEVNVPACEVSQEAPTKVQIGFTQPT